jgi:hypothetical protein
MVCFRKHFSRSPLGLESKLILGVISMLSHNSRYAIRLASMMVWTAVSAPAWAQSVFTEVESARNLDAFPARSAAIDRIKSDRATRSMSIVRIDADLLRGSVNRSVELNVRSNLKLDAHAQAVEPLNEGRFVWKGEISGGSLPDGTATIVINGGNATGTIQAPDGRLFRLQPVGGGENALIEVDQVKLPPDHSPGAPPPVRPKSEIRLAPPQALEDTRRAPPVIDLVVAYTKNAKAAAVDIDSLIDLAIAETNQSFVNSGISASVRLAGTVEYDYSDATRSDETCAPPAWKCAFARITNAFGGVGDGNMDTIHELRNTHGGDVGVLIIDNTEACGRAYEIAAAADTAFVIVHGQGCATGYYSFGHEIGHLAGARHDLENDPTTTPFAYGHGFRHPASEEGWRTIMGYNCSDGRCPTRIQYWSNPKKKHGGIALGTAASEDNVRVWNERATVMAAFKTAPSNRIADTPGR